MTAIQDEERIPEIDDYELFCKFYDKLLVQREPTLRRIAESIGKPASKVSITLDTLEKAHGVILFHRKQRKGVSTDIPKATRQLYNAAKQLLQNFETIKSWEPSNSRKRRTLRVGVTNALLVFMIPKILQRFREDPRYQSVEFEFTEGDIPDLISAVREWKLDLALGPTLPQKMVGNLNRRMFDRKLDCAFICSPTSKFAYEIEHDKRQCVYPHELREESVFVLREGLQPEGVFETIPPPRKSGIRFEVLNYTSILACVRMGLGVGVIPAWPDFLRPLRRQRELYSVPFENVGDLSMEAYYPHKSEDNFTDLDTEIREAFLNTIEESVSIESPSMSQWFEAHSTLETLPADVTAFTHLYSINTLSEKQDVGSIWRYSKLNWSSNSEAQQTMYRGKNAVTEYHVSAHSKEKFLELSGMNSDESQSNDTYVARYGFYSESGVYPRSGVFIGSWAGVDSCGQPLTSISVVSRTKLSGDDFSNKSLYSIVDKTIIGFISKAQRFDVDAPGFLSANRRTRKSPRK